jgi:RHS repeat-associated protein
MPWLKIRVFSLLANPPLLSQIVFATNGMTRMTTSKTYDYLNRLTAISSQPTAQLVRHSFPARHSFNDGGSGGGSLQPIASALSYNAANQRTKNTLADGSYWMYAYDSLGQVTNGCKYFPNGAPVPGQQFDYAFDTIGNRTQTWSVGNTNGTGLFQANYTNNLLNQITGRGVPPFVDVTGASILTNTVTVNGQTAYRNQEYYRQALTVNNTNSALWTNITVSGGQTVTGHVYVPQQPEVFQYDPDGNLTNDGRWAYSWDAENRLIGMTVNTNVGPQYQLTFAYDPKGRRIQKLVTTGGVPTYTNNFLYDGWNLVAETGPNNSLIRTYVWGTDLSGSPQGAGGVGGLLLVTFHSSLATTNAFVAFDGNGNVTALINAADGTLLANYDYGPFGEPIRLTGPLAKANPFRFSTKYQDDESDLLYYGRRYYKPSTGTWLSRDPIQEMGGLNLYCFVGNKTLSRVDKLGLFSFVCDKCKSGNIRSNGVIDWSLIPTIKQGNPNVVSSAMGALSGSELVGWVTDIGAVATGLTAAEMAEKIAEVAKSIADSGTGHGISPDSGIMSKAISQIQALYGKQEGYFIAVDVAWQKCEMTTSPQWGGGFPYTSHLDWVSHSSWYIDSELGDNGNPNGNPSGDGFAPTDSNGIANALGLACVAALQNTSY